MMASDEEAICACVQRSRSLNLKNNGKLSVIFEKFISRWLAIIYNNNL